MCACLNVAGLQAIATDDVLFVMKTSGPEPAFNRNTNSRAMFSHTHARTHAHFLSLSLSLSLTSQDIDVAESRSQRTDFIASLEERVMQREAKRREDERVISEARLRRSSPRRRSVEDQVWEAGGDNVNFGAKKPTSCDRPISGPGGSHGSNGSGSYGSWRRPRADLGFPLDVRKSSGS